MNESLLQFIWMHSLYDATGIKTIAGEPVIVSYCGRLNRDAGPDFLEAKVRVGDTLLVGNVELHMKSSDWYRHGHQHDAAYRHLALHVVYEDDAPGEDHTIPVIALRDRVSPEIIARYSGMQNNREKLPCSGLHEQVRSLTKEAWLTRLLAERWEEKLAEWDMLLGSAGDDWSNLLYWRMAANFGFKTNAEPFLMLARSLPLNTLSRHKDSLVQLEALLFGQAGMLEGDFIDDYPRELQREYDYLRKKYRLKPLNQGVWKFMRMRPANFPTIRIAQFACLIHKSVHLFSQIAERHTVAELEQLLDVTASDYWTDHYRFDAARSNAFPAALGKSSILNIVINTIAPIQFLYAARHGTQELQEKALQLLESVPAESNHVIRLMESYNWTPVNAAQSQAMIQLYNRYCFSKRCLECAVGHSIFKSSVPRLI